MAKRDEALHGLSLFPRCRDYGGGRFGLQSGTVRPADGHSGNGHADRVGWKDLGKLADFVVLSDDLFTVDKEKIKDLQIVRTVVGGTTVYQA